MFYFIIKWDENYEEDNKNLGCINLLFILSEE